MIVKTAISRLFGKSRSDIVVRSIPRPKIASGMVEVVVSIDGKRSGSSYVLTSPRHMAFRKS